MDLPDETPGEAPDDALRQWCRLRSSVEEATQAAGSRLTDAVEFVFQVDEAVVFEGADDPAFDEAAAYDDAQRQTAAEILDPAGAEFPDLELVSRNESIGRGAGGVAVAIVVTGTVVVPAVMAWLDAAERIAQLWQWMRKRQGPRPSLSLGAAKYICLADLARRLNRSLDDVILVWSGDVGPGAQMDINYSGADLYGLLFAGPERSWMYIVSDAGEVVVFAEGAAIPGGPAYYLGLPFDRPELPPLLDDDEGPVA